MSSQDRAREAADAITSTLFTSGFDVGKVDQLTLVRDGCSGDFGGWCEGAVQAKVSAALAAHAAAEVQRALEEAAISVCRGCAAFGAPMEHMGDWAHPCPDSPDGQGLLPCNAVAIRALAAQHKDET